MQKSYLLFRPGGARTLAIGITLALPVAMVRAPPPAQRAIPPDATFLGAPTSSLHIAHRTAERATFKDWVVFNARREVTRGIVTKATLLAAAGSKVTFAGEVKFGDTGLVDWGILAADSSLRAVGPEQHMLPLKAGTYVYFVAGNKGASGGVLKGVLSAAMRFITTKGETVEVPAGNAILLNAQGQLVGWTPAGDTD
jgi:hypothetical protein